MDSTVGLEHAFKSEWMVFGTKDTCLLLKTFFTDDITCPVFVLEYSRGTKESPLKIYVTKEELAHLTRDPLEFGRVGHLTILEVSTGMFAIRDEFAPMAPCPFKNSTTTRPIRVNGFAHQHLKLAVKEIFEDIDQLADMVKKVNSCDNYLMSKFDQPILGRFALACAWEITAGGDNNRRLERRFSQTMYKTDHSKLSEVLKPSRLSVPDEKCYRIYNLLDVNSTHRYSMQQAMLDHTSYPSTSWCAHNFMCSDKECLELL